MSWYPDRLLRALLGWTVFTASLPTLITYRALLQPEYEWGMFGLMDRGITRGSWLIVIAGIFAWSTIILGYRGARWPFHLFLGLWHAFLFANTVHAALTLGEKMELRGDTMGLRINVAILAPLLSGLALAHMLLICVGLLPPKSGASGLND